MSHFNIYALFDTKIGAFGMPQFVENNEAAIRILTDVVSKGDGEVGKHPQDFVLMLIGTYDRFTGEIVCFDEQITVVEAGDLYADAVENLVQMRTQLEEQIGVTARHVQHLENQLDGLFSSMLKSTQTVHDALQASLWMKFKRFFR